MKKKTDSTISLPVWAQLLLPVLVTVLCAGIVLLCSIRPYEQAKTYLKVAFMAGSTSAAGESTNGLNIVQTDIDTDYTGKTDSEGTPAQWLTAASVLCWKRNPSGCTFPSTTAAARNCWSRERV